KLNKHNLEKKIIFYIASFILFAAIIVAILIIVGGEKNLISREQKQLLIVSKAIYKDYTTFFQDVTDVGLALNKSLKQQILSSDQIPDFEQKAETIVRSEDGAIRIDDGVSGAFVAKDTSLDADLLKDIINTQKTFEIISDVAKTHWFNLYFISKQNFIRIVPKDWALEIEADHSFNKDVFYQIADPEHNPERQPRWTPVYYDEIWKKWMTSLIIPIYDGEEFIGITGSDIFLDTLFEKVSILYAETSEYKAVIFDADGNILVHPESRNSILYQSGKMNTLLNMSDLNDPILNKLIPEIISAKFNFGMINTTDNMINNYYYYVNNIPSIDWYLCIYAAKSTLLKELNIYIIKILSFAIGLSIIVILIIRLYIKRFLLKRITNLNTAISKISSGDMDAKIEQKYNDEIGVLEKGFSEMQLSLIMKFAELREAEKDIQDSEERYQSYVNNAPDGIFIINEIGEFKFANQTAFVITGYKKTELLQMTVNDLLAEDSKREGKQHLDLVIKNSKATTELLYQTKSGETKHWSVSSVKLSEIRILCFAKDVTDRKLAELKLKDYYQNLEKAIKERTHELEESQTALIYMLEDVNETQEALKISNNQISEVNKDLESFAYSISHDLRAPLRSIIGFSEIVLKRHAANLNEEGKKYLNYVVEAGNHLANLIDDLLKYSRISKKPNNSVNMTNELRKVINKLKGDISAKDAKVILPKKLPILRSNVGLINQIFSNLILNGITYQNKGSKPIVEISVKAEEDNFIFMIQDNGIGIDEKYQEKIFDIFQRLHTQEDFPGSGIGLALVKKAVKKLGGSIRLNSKLGEGTTFIVALPK
ncbi:MAG: PAS domain S-box protein, partial [Candidatus Cloacimonetes bacterium]|nr:PAS domain S-box protein [Candidatus Cloacimonadota bacterium]